jgi:hypothetical protein
LELIEIVEKERELAGVKIEGDDPTAKREGKKGEVSEIVTKEKQGKRTDLEGSNIVAMPRSEKGYLLKRTFGSPVCGMTGRPLGQKNKKSGEDESKGTTRFNAAGCFLHYYSIFPPYDVAAF